MKFFIISVTVLCSFLIIQAEGSEAALAPNEIKIQESSVKHGPKFGEGWSDEQKIVWNTVQKWWQLRMVKDWENMEKMYHNDAVLFPYFLKAPIDFSELEESIKDSMEFGVIYCTVYEIRIIENVAVVMMYYEVFDPIPPKRMIFVLLKQGGEWKFIATMAKDE